MDLKEHIVGEVEGYPVIYIEEHCCKVFFIEKIIR